MPLFFVSPQYLLAKMDRALREAESASRPDRRAFFLAAANKWKVRAERGAKEEAERIVREAESDVDLKR